MKNSTVLALLGGILFFASGCYTERISNQNLSYLYDRDASFLHPKFNIIHKNDSVTELHFRINSNELLYLQNPESKFYSAFFRIRYEVYTQLESKVLIDSSVVLFADSNLVMDGKIISGILTLKPSQVKESLIKIDVADLRRNSLVRRYFQINRENPSCRQFFTLRLADGQYPLSRNYIRKDEVVILTHASGATDAKVRYYNREFPLPKPPFSIETPKVFDYEADSIFNLKLNQPFSLEKEGFYHIQLSDSTKHGYTIYRFKESFPEVKTVEDLIAPLRFINSNSEFKALTEGESPKAQVDEFWLNLAGSADRAKMLIQKYYSRVEDANEFFTSYTEGWRTDRGLIYLIFGPPNTIYKNSESEFWVYGEEGNSASLNLTFSKMENPFTDNDFLLDRSPIYKSNWYNRVDMWRQGRIPYEN